MNIEKGVFMLKGKTVLLGVTGSIAGMKKIYGKEALLVRCGSWIYNVTSKPDIYYGEAH